MNLHKYQCVLAACAVAIFFTGTDVYLFLSERTEHPPLVWIVAFGLFCLPLLFARRALETVVQTPLVMWCALFLLVSGAWLFFQPVISETVWKEFSRRILSVFFLVGLLLTLTGERARVWARRAVACAVALAVALNFYELFTPLTFSEVAGRSAGLYINPNKTGAALVIGMIVSLGALAERYRVFFILLVGAGVAATFSRAAIVGWALVVFLMFACKQLSLRRTLFNIGFGAGVVALALIPWWGAAIDRLSDSGAINSNVIARLEWFRTGQGEDASTLERREVAELAWTMVLEQPLTGHGVAASVDWGHEKSSHNLYLNMMVDHGALGILVLPLLVVAVGWRARGEARRLSLVFGFFILFMGFFSHNLLEERFILIGYALVAALVRSSADAEKRDEKISTHVYRHPLPQLHTQAKELQTI